MGMLSRLLALSSLLAFASALPTNKVREDTSLSKHPQPRFVHYYAILPARRQEAAKLTNRHKRETILEDDTVADDVAAPIQPRQLEEEEPLQAVSVAGVNIENLLLDAERYIDAETLSEVDLSDPEAVLKLKEMVERQQARNAQFNFGYSVQDGISDSFMERTEERDGLALRGEYSYSDGYFKRTVSYVADDKGYRVTSMKNEPIGEGPSANDMGRAIVHTFVGGVETQYAIQAQPVEEVNDEGGAEGREGVASSEKKRIQLVEIEPNFDEIVNADEEPIVIKAANVGQN